MSASPEATGKHDDDAASTVTKDQNPENGTVEEEEEEEEEEGRETDQSEEGEASEEVDQPDKDQTVKAPPGTEGKGETGGRPKIDPSPQNESRPSGPPLPNEPLPQTEDDGWDCHWDQGSQRWFFANRYTGLTQWTNPRVQDQAAAAGVSAPQPPKDEQPAAGGYNPAIHGDYDPTAWYAKAGQDEDDYTSATAGMVIPDAAGIYASTVAFNRATGQFQTDDQGPDRHTDEAKARRQMNAYFDVDAAANSHDGRSLKAERSNQKVSKKELKAFKEKRRVKKEEKRRAWLKE